MRRTARTRRAIVAMLLAATAALAPAVGVGLTPDELGLIIDDADPLSVQVGDYYRRARHIPLDNVVHVRLAQRAWLSAGEFAPIRRQVQTALPGAVQALALAWTEPYAVDCVSITSAFALPFATGCANSCALTPRSAYFDSDSRAPFTELDLRPAMMLAAKDLPAARALIDRGVRADDSAPLGTAYLLDTSDPVRDVRAPTFVAASRLAAARLRVQILRANTLRDRSDVLFYFTGAAWVPDLGTLRFLPGAIADHLTSYGGALVGSRQMSSLAWLAAGATGSYGTVVEPCNSAQKFPSVPVVMRRYLAGETLIEAYWKSVARPSQGVFIGEPLARPYPRGVRQATLERMRATSAEVDFSGTRGINTTRPP